MNENNEPPPPITDRTAFSRYLNNAGQSNVTKLILTANVEQQRQAIRTKNADEDVYVVRLPVSEIISQLSMFSGLTKLTMIGYKLSDAPFEKLAELLHLTHLNLPSSRIRPPDLEKITQIDSLTNLDLSGNFIGTATESINLWRLKNLIHLDLGSNELSVVTARDISKLEHLSELQLFGNKLGDEGVASLEPLERLTVLNLGHNAISNIKAPTMSRFVRLRKLSLSLNQVGDDGARVIAELVNLESLDLHRNKISESGGDALGALARLKFLNISNNPIGFAGAHGLSRLNFLDTLLLAEGGLGVQGTQVISKMSTLTSLSISDDDIGDTGARHLSELRSLTGLSLYKTNIGDDGVESIARLKNLVKLTLMDNRIGDKGLAAISKLAELRELVISGAAFGTDGLRSLGEIESLTSLFIHGANVTPSGLGALQKCPRLARLSLSHTNCGDDGAKAISTIHSLTSLELASASIGDAGAESLGRLSNLLSLSLSYNEIGPRGARGISELPKLERLEIGNNALGDEGAMSLARIKSLTFLQVPNNRIGPRGADAIADLSKLLFLDVGSNKIGPEGCFSLSKLSSLGKLNIPANGVGSEGARGLSKIASLYDLSAAQNDIRDEGAKALSSLTNLTSLFLSYNNIGDEGASALGALINLESLTLSFNDIGSIGLDGLAALTGLWNLELKENRIPNYGLRLLLDRWAANGLGARTLNVDENPCSILPKEILATHDAQAIVAAYSRYLISTKEVLNEAKLLVVGNEAVGKTSLIRYLTQDKPRNPDEVKTVGVTAHERIETSSWSPTAEGPRLNVWDFGGQEIMHETHKFFLTERSIYLLVLENRREDDNSVYKWMKTIANRCGNSPVLIIINKCDDGQQKLLLDETGIARAWPNVISVMRTSCNEGELAAQMILRLRSKIVDTLASDPRMAHIRDTLPTPWRRVKDAVSERARNMKVLTHHDFIHLCEDADGTDKIIDEREQRALLRLLHDLGVVIAHGLSSNAPAAIQSVRLLDPNWLTGAIYKVLTAGLVVHQNGMFRREQLAQLLPPDLYPPSRWEFILSMMQFDNMGLCFPLDGSPHTYLVPEALPKNAPNYDHWPDDSLRFRFNYEFLPPGLIPRLLVEAHRKVTETRWRSGAVFSVTECQILVRGNVDKQRLDILVAGPPAMRRSALGVILEDLHRVHELNSEAKPESRVPLPDNPEATVSYEHLLWIEQHKGPGYMIIPEGAECEYSVGELLDGVGRRLRSDSRSYTIKPSSQRFDVLIITALKEEYDALLSVVNTNWTKHTGKLVYHTCTFGEGNGLQFVAVRLTKMGGISLARSAAPLIERFSPRCLAMCGVCAGNPNETDLGDVVLADRVFQYDEGKYKTDGFQGDHWVQANTDAWLYEAQETEGPAHERHGFADATEEDARWWFLEKLLTAKDPMRSTALRRFFPDSRRRGLLDSLEREGLVRFSQDTFTLTDAGRAAIHRHLKFDGILVGTHPFHVHVGPIASGNAVQADGTIWRHLPSERKTLAVEMEAAALGELARQHSLPFAVAKGVMDFADEHKNERFKAFAARASAEVLCHFLLRAMRM